jgi:hypothetical protein
MQQSIALRVLVALVLIGGCTDATAPTPCTPAVVDDLTTWSGEELAAGPGCVRTVHWYNEAVR